MKVQETQLLPRVGPLTSWRFTNALFFFPVINAAYGGVMKEVIEALNEKGFRLGNPKGAALSAGTHLSFE